ncbi:hypothetical protein D3C86_2255630 [compost metagenome]
MKLASVLTTFTPTVPSGPERVLVAGWIRTGTVRVRLTGLTERPSGISVEMGVAAERLLRSASRG